MDYSGIFTGIGDSIQGVGSIVYSINQKKANQDTLNAQRDLADKQIKLEMWKTENFQKNVPYIIAGVLSVIITIVLVVMLRKK